MPNVKDSIDYLCPVELSMMMSALSSLSDMVPTSQIRLLSTLNKARASKELKF